MVNESSRSENLYRKRRRKRRSREKGESKYNWWGDCKDSSSLYGAPLAPVVVKEDFAFSFGANTSLLFLLGFKVSSETSQTA